MPNVIRVLVKHGAGINDKDPRERAPLHVAAIAGHLEAIKVLLELGADKYCKDRSGDTPTHNAVERGHLDCARALINHGSFDFKIKGYQGRTVLHAAASTGSPKMVKYLLEQVGGRRTINDYDDQRSTPLHLAFQSTYEGVEAVRLLLHHGADTGLKDGHGWAAVDWAKSLGRGDELAWEVS